MNIRHAAWALVACLSTGLSVAHAETQLTLSNVHLCCGACVKAVQKAAAKVEGTKVNIKADAEQVEITAPNDETAQKLVDTLAEAGFHGKSNHEKIQTRDDSGAVAGKTNRVELTGVHNCCGSCNDAIHSTVTGVAGVLACTARPRQESFVVEGNNVELLDLVRALNEAGFHVKVKK